MTSKNRLDRVYKNAKTFSFNDESKLVLFSDCHRGDNSFADDFAANGNIYFHALKYYYAESFTYCELGDGDELWENLTFKTIFNAHKNVYMLLKLFHDSGKLHMIWGNHDMVYKSEAFVKKTLSTYFDPVTGTDAELFKDIQYHEGIILKHTDTQQELFLIHGHQADWWNYTFWKWSRFMVRILWKPLNVMGFSDPTSPAKNYKELIKVERRLKKWIVENKNILT